MSKPKDDKLVVIFSGVPLDAEKVKQLLQNHKIDASVMNSYTSSIAPYIAPEASVMIMQKDKEEADVLLKYLSLSN